MNKPTPRTDAATYPADCLGKTLVTNRDLARTLETELAAATTERDQLRAQLHALNLICGTTDADKFTTWVDRANARAERAEADAERYRLVTLRQDAELATERGKLDWVFENCKVEANDYTTGNRDVYYVHDREDLGAAMKEDAK